MDRLPIEIVILVFENLEDLDLAPTPYSRFTEDPADQLVYGDDRNNIYHKIGRSNCWVNLTQGSYADILNARLAFSVLYHASHKSFAKLLGDRRFRLTNIGFQDLILVSRNKNLIPHIKTLTFGCATFRRIFGINKSGFVWPRTFLSGLHSQDRARLAAAYMACRNWQHDNMESHTKHLASIVRGFPNLDSVRVVTVDHVAHLGGWLKPGDEDLLHRDQVLYHDRSAQALSRGSPIPPPRLYNNESAVVNDCIMEALKLSKLTIRDFRADPKPLYLAIIQTRIFIPALHTLRMVFFEQDLVHLDSSQWSKLFGHATGLADLSLRIDGQNFRPWFEARTDKRNSISEQLLRAFQQQGQLQRVELFGGWAFSETAIVNFVAAHSDSLRCLLLSHPLLLGKWQSALEAIASTTHGKLEFMKVRQPVESDSIGATLVGNPTLDLDVLNFGCPFQWIPGGVFV